MSQYHGGKQKIGKYIAKIIFDIARDNASRFEIVGYAEPFCGMLGVFRHSLSEASSLGRKLTFVAGDINKSLIMMWKKVQQGWVPPASITKQEYADLKNTPKSSALKGFFGHAASHRGIYFSGYSKSTNIGYSSEKIIEIGTKLSNVHFYTGQFDKYPYKGYIIYCDPPYFKSSRYYDEMGNQRAFDYEYFYTWAEKMAKYNLVFISERADLPYTLVARFGPEKLFLIKS